MTQNSALEPTTQLCTFLANLKYNDIPPEVIARVQDLLLDHFGTSLHSMPLPWTQTVRLHAESRGGVAESTVYGSKVKLDRTSAALVNGTAAHGIELDDTHNASFSHPGAVVIPAALAVAEAIGASGREFLTAIVAGYEAQGRAGATANQLLTRGFHPTATAGTFGAAAACAHLLQLDEKGFISTFGLAASAASGLMQFAEDPEGNMVKRLYGGMPAQNGLTMAHLAAGGLEGPRGSLCGRFGFVNVLGGGGDMIRLTQGLGSEWQSDQISIKLYACCRHFHAIIDALLECMSDPRYNAAEVVAINVLTTGIALDGRMQYRPQSVMAAQYSLPFAVAATLLLDPRNPGSYSEEAARRPDVTAMMDKVTAHADSALEKLLPERFPGGVEITLASGAKLKSMKSDSLGTIDYPLGHDGIVGKLRALTADICSESWQDQLIDAVGKLPVAPHIETMAALLRNLSNEAA